jgi:ribosomal protein S18 acetylase RimI-like enzyme
MQKIDDTITNSLEIIQTTDLIDFIPLLKELEFGDKFSLAMLKWCGIGQRNQLLAFWEVYLAKIEAQTIGVMGLYQQVDSQNDVAWVGWFGIRPQFRRQGWGKIMIEQLKKYARQFGFQQLWVYTNSPNLAAVSFYESSGFVKLGVAAEVCPGKTNSLSDIILKSNLDKL